MRFEVFGKWDDIDIRILVYGGSACISWMYRSEPDTTLTGWVDKSMVGYTYPMTIGDLKSCWNMINEKEDPALVLVLAGFIATKEMALALEKEMDNE